MRRLGTCVMLAPTIPSLLGGTQSPFNIADQFTVPYFTPAEVADLLTQHTTEMGR